MRTTSLVFWSRLCFIIFIWQSVSCQSISSLSQKNECYIFIQPLTGFDLRLNQKKEDVLKLFDSHEYNSDVSEVVSISNKIFFNVEEKIQSDKLEGVKLVGLLGFDKKSNELVSYELEIYVGRDIELYNRLIEYLENEDKQKINEFIYARKRLHNSFRKKGCYGLFSFGRSNKLNGEFVIQIDCARR